MRIALFSECFSPVTNGVVTSMLTLRETLRAWGHTVYVFAPGAPQPGDDSETFRLPELPFPRHPYHFARPFPRLARDLKALDVDIVHCQHPFTIGRLGADLARRTGAPMVYTAHSLYDTMASYAKSPIIRAMGPKAARGVVRRFCARAECVIAPSRATRDALRADGVRARFAVVPTGVSEPCARPRGRAIARSKLRVVADQPVILCVGRVGPEKRLDLLLHAVAALQEMQLPPPASDFRLGLVGDGQSRGSLEDLAKRLGIQHRVVFAGAQPHNSIGDWYAAADIFALSSPVETQGLVVVEAMAAGLPCVTVDYGGPREIVVDGDTGLRVPFDAVEFASALKALLLDPALRRTMGARGRRRSSAFSPEGMGRGVLGVYHNVLAAQRRVGVPTAPHVRRSPTFRKPHKVGAWQPP